MWKWAAILILCAPSFGATVYVSQSGGSLSCGADGTQTTTALASVTWTAGNTYKICGTLTNAMTVGASGSSGNLITVYFETGAKINLGVCGSSGCLNVAGKSFVLIDGGPTCGWVNQALVSCNGQIEASSSGTSFGNGGTSSFTVVADGCSNCEIRNLEIGPTYIHNSLSDSPSGDFRAVANLTGTGATSYHIHNNVIHDTSSAVVFVPNGAGVSGFEFDHNAIYNMNSGTDISNNNNGTITGGLVHDNHYYNTSGWDTTGCAQHHNSMHAFAFTTSNSGIQFYNNLIDGNWGGCPTSELFYEGSGSINNSCIVYNNIFIATYTQENNGVVSISCGGSGNLFANNTVIGDFQSGDQCISINPASGSGWTVKNNIISGCNQPLASNTTVATFEGAMSGGMDYNTWGGTAGSPWALNCSGGCTYFNTLTAWTSSTTFDAHSNWTNNNTYVKVNSNGSLQAGSPAIGAGVNLTSALCGTYATLCLDQNGAARPSGLTAWDAGALNGSSSNPLPAPFGTFFAGNFGLK